MRAVRVECVLVQPTFAAFERGVEFIAEHPKAQRLRLAQPLGVDQTLCQQASCVNSVANAGDLTLPISMQAFARLGLLPID